MKNIAGIFAISEAVIYLIAFVIYGLVLQFPSGDATQTISFLQQNYRLLSVMNLMMYVLFGGLLSVLVLAIYQYTQLLSPNLSQIAAVFGLLWVALVIATGMIANIALTTVTNMSDAEQALETWRTIGIITEGLGGGNEVVGGLWVLLLTLATYQDKRFPKFLFLLGLLVGFAGICTMYPLALFTEIFGLSQIIWFIAIGVFLIRLKPLT